MKTPYLLYYVFAVLIFSSCLPIQALRFNSSDYHSKPKFKTHLVENDTSNIFEFHDGGKDWQERIGSFETRFTLSKDNRIEVSIDSFLNHHSSTTAFIVIHNDTILYEKYFQGYEKNSLLPSFSLAKGFTSALVGIAIEEGFIQSIHDPIVKYIPELEDKPFWWDSLTIYHLLNMKSGIRYQNAIGFQGLKDLKLPYFGDGTIYFSKNVMDVIRQARYDIPPVTPSTSRNYSNLDNQLLGIVIEKATGKSLSDYLEEKVWKKTGMQSDAKWGIDSKRKNVVKSYCCMEVTALDYARFLRLYLNDGYWNGESIIPKDWIKTSMLPGQDKMEEGSYEYMGASNQNQWWIDIRQKSIGRDSISVAKKLTSPDYQFVKKRSRYWGLYELNTFSAQGVFDQHIITDPKSDLIMIRLGKDFDGDYDIYEPLFNQIRFKIFNKKSDIMDF